MNKPDLSPVIVVTRRTVRWALVSITAAFVAMTIAIFAMFQVYHDARHDAENATVVANCRAQALADAQSVAYRSIAGLMANVANLNDRQPFDSSQFRALAAQLLAAADSLPPRIDDCKTGS